MNSFTPLIDRILEFWPPENWKDYTVLVAVSGGVDSVCLAHVMAQAFARLDNAQGHLELVHINHQVRESATGDEAWVIEYARQLNLPVHVRKIDSQQLDSDGSGREAVLRTRRYELLEEIAADTGARYILTGHHADDQVETILHRMIRGTGIAGLKGIPPTRALNDSVTIARPLLQARKQELIDYLHVVGQTYRFDESNDDTTFTRNRIRHQLLPQMRNLFGDAVDESLLRLATSASEYDQYVLDQSDTLDGMIRVAPARIEIDLVAARKHAALLIKRKLQLAWPLAGFGLREMSRAKWDQLVDVLHEKTVPPKIQLPGGITVAICGDRAQLQSGETSGNTESASG